MSTFMTNKHWLALLALLWVASHGPSVMAQTVRRVDGLNGSATGNGSGWGSQANTWGSCPSNQVCAADVACTPGFPQAAVNVNDLLFIINNWGPCDGSAGEEDMPTSIQDCMDICQQAHPGDQQAYTECLNKCIDALCQAELIDCDE